VGSDFSIVGFEAMTSSTNSNIIMGIGVRKKNIYHLIVFVLENFWRRKR
jgi:hypothetical protein